MFGRSIVETLRFRILTIGKHTIGSSLYHLFKLLQRTMHRIGDRASSSLLLFLVASLFNVGESLLRVSQAKCQAVGSLNRRGKMTT